MLRCRSSYVLLAIVASLCKVLAVNTLGDDESLKMSLMRARPKVGGHHDAASKTHLHTLDKADAASPINAALLLRKRSRASGSSKTAVIISSGEAQLDERSSRRDTMPRSSRASSHGEIQLEAAEPIYRRTWKAREEILGPIHPRTLTSSNNVAGLLRNMGKHAEADPIYRRTLKAKEEAADDHVRLHLEDPVLATQSLAAVSQAPAFGAAASAAGTAVPAAGAAAAGSAAPALGASAPNATVPAGAAAPNATGASSPIILVMWVTGIVIGACVSLALTRRRDLSPYQQATRSVPFERQPLARPPGYQEKEKRFDRLRSGKSVQSDYEGSSGESDSEEKPQAKKPSTKTGGSPTRGDSKQSQPETTHEASLSLSRTGSNNSKRNRRQ